MRRVIGAVLPAALLLALSAAALPAHADDGYPITVNVVGDGSSDPGSGGSGDPGAGGPGSGGDSGPGFGDAGSGSGGSGFGDSGSGSGDSGSGGAGAGGAGDAGSDAPGDDSTKSGAGKDGAGTDTDAIGRSLFGVDAVRLGYAFSLNAASGWLDTSIVLHNGSAKAGSATVRGWLTGPFGIRLGAADVQRVTVPAGGVATVRLHLGEVGQWGLITSHIEATPQLNGLDLERVSREQTIFVVPWLLVGLLVVGAAVGYPLYRIVRSPDRVPAAAVSA